MFLVIFSLIEPFSIQLAMRLDTKIWKCQPVLLDRKLNSNPSSNWVLTGIIANNNPYCSLDQKVMHVAGLKT